MKARVAAYTGSDDRLTCRELKERSLIYGDFDEVDNLIAEKRMKMVETFAKAHQEIDKAVCMIVAKDGTVLSVAEE